MLMRASCRGNWVCCTKTTRRQARGPILLGIALGEDTLGLDITVEVGWREAPLDSVREVRGMAYASRPDLVVELDRG